MASKNGVAFQVVLFCICLVVANSVDFSYPAVFNFGDSNSDTGELVAGYGIQLAPPNGQNYFKTPSGRFSNGRLIVDFLMDAMGLPFLNAYMDSLGLPNFHQGCNLLQLVPLSFQHCNINQPILLWGSGISVFCYSKLGFLNCLQENCHNNVSGKEFDQYIPAEDYFQKGLYMFDIGQNDLAGAFYTKKLDQVLSSIPTILLELKLELRNCMTMELGNFWIHNTGPLGCLPQVVAKFGTDHQSLMNKDVLDHTTKLLKPLIYSFKLSGVETTHYGLLWIWRGPPLNYDSRVSCGLTKILNGTTITAKGCNDSSMYVNWDGIHYTEAASHMLHPNSHWKLLQHSFVRQNALPSLAQVLNLNLFVVIILFFLCWLREKNS
ncbi:GDSL lipase/esterase [Sesbania bispinosa]|nr:GDSL lipase/esterase [Sesbania bispinosa]